MLVSITPNRLFTLGFAIMFASLWFAPGCTKEKGEIIIPEYCDTIHIFNPDTVSFECDIKPILNANCMVGCHTPTAPQGVPFLNTYDLVQKIGGNGDLMCTITWDGCTDMPYLSGTKIDSSDIDLIAEWINQGMPI